MREWLALFSVLVLAACAQLPSAPPSGYALSGKLSIRDARQSQQAMFGWQASAQEDRISIDSPLGQTLAALTIRYDDDGLPLSALFEQGGEMVQAADDPEALLKDLTGLSLPLEGLRWWLRGEVSPFTPAERHEQEGTVTLRQDGWTIEARDFRPLGKRQQPYRIQANRDDLQLRIVITDAIDNPTSELPSAP
ncbi:lipoprotein insertase outer membrane protein LolB [Chitinilyticum piscinae]|uniref:Outer-membrane lipoprotein LolB n=1 Tax=Chitinilyticum piscinae TaxID=2866724 RepID=A0A8J7FKC4_9NEIS|nr:lipoprotein insertase outer membrane protein LolB [Chitinilyticum piscinae]MBE9609225.1 outer membrane lipoprotein LolB [Chitinilyticum piscinae]